VRDGGVLKVFKSATFTGSVWVTELEPAIKTVNAELTRIKLSLQFQLVDEAAGAHVVLETKDGNGLHGQDELEIGGVSTMRSAHIKLPGNPTISQTKDGTPAGGPVKRHVIAHELIHGIGLDNGEHADDGGVFVGRLVLSIGTKGGKQQAADGSDSVPAIKLAPSTIKALKVAWPS
jgi:hypothetical protein